MRCDAHYFFIFKNGAESGPLISPVSSILTHAVANLWSGGLWLLCAYVNWKAVVGIQRLQRCAARMQKGT